LTEFFREDIIFHKVRSEKRNFEPPGYHHLEVVGTLSLGAPWARYKLLFKSKLCADAFNVGRARFSLCRPSKSHYTARNQITRFVDAVLGLAG